MSNLVRMSLSLEKPLLDRLEAMVARSRYTNRSAAEVLTRSNLASVYGVETSIAWNGTNSVEAVFHQNDDPRDMGRGPKGN